MNNHKRRNSWEWYTVKLLFECILSGDPTPGSIDENYSDIDKTYEESVFLVRAQSLEHAFSVANRKAKNFEHSYINCYGELVQWNFVRTLDSFKLFDEKIANGTELYSRFIRVPKGITTEKVISYYYPETLGEWKLEG